MRDTIWSSEMIARLKELWCQTDDGYLSASGIARVLACSTNAVIGKAHRLGLPPRQSPIKRDPDAPVAPVAPRRVLREDATLPPLPALTIPAAPIETSLSVEASIPVEVERALDQAGDDRSGVVEIVEAVQAAPGAWDVTPADLEAVADPAPKAAPASGGYVRQRPCSRVYEKIGTRWRTCDGIALGKSSFCPACEKQVYQRNPNNARDGIAA